MRRNNGFTLLELLVTFVVMVILMGLAIVMLRTTQTSTRDKERESDISVIARGLENRYDRNSILVGGSGAEIFTAPGYPSVNEILFAQNNDVPGYTKRGNFLTNNLQGTNGQAFIGPKGGQFTVICTSSCPAAENAARITSTTSGVNIDNYVYEPITASNTICITFSTECVRFNLYYRTESPNQVNTVRSNRQ